MAEVAAVENDAAILAFDEQLARSLEADQKGGAVVADESDDDAAEIEEPLDPANLEKNPMFGLWNLMLKQLYRALHENNILTPQTTSLDDAPCCAACGTIALDARLRKDANGDDDKQRWIGFAFVDRNQMQACLDRCGEFVAPITYIHFNIPPDTNDRDGSKRKELRDRIGDIASEKEFWASSEQRMPEQSFTHQYQYDNGALLVLPVDGLKLEIAMYGRRSRMNVVRRRP